jgi:1,4-dihydroxy-6-naphthoate synthase
MIRLAFSPCPNDTFIFDAIVHKKIDLEDLEFEFDMADIEELNRRVLKESPDMIKISYSTYLQVFLNYALLDAGSAFGFGNGPVVVSKTLLHLNQLRNHKVAIPGEHTTAHFLFRIAFPAAQRKSFMHFSKIEESVLKGECGAGVIIHEGRFTYERKGLIKIMDLGEFWQNLTGTPVPLGCIVVRKELGLEMTAKLNRVMRRSVEYALANRDDVMPFVRKNAKEMEKDIMVQHINFYVNDLTLDLGDTGKKAIAELMNYSVK